jgi:lipoprotein YgeR
MAKVFYAFFFLIILGFPKLYSQSFYIIQDGETIYRVSVRFNIPVNELMLANEISDPSKVKVGTRIVIPNKNETKKELAELNNMSSYKVKKGDTYYSIAKAAGITVDKLIKINNKNISDNLQVGEVLNLISSITAQKDKVIREPHTPSVITYENNKVGQSLSSPENSELIWPTHGNMSNYQGKQKGVRISSEIAQDVKSVASGVVVYLGQFRELGPVVIIEKENNYYYIYSGVSISLVRLGEKVSLGTILGRSMPNQDVIFSVFKDANPIDPKDAPRI